MLLHDDGREAFIARDACNGAQQFLDDDGRQAFERLVQQQQPRVEHERSADSQHLLLAPGQLGAQVGLALGQAREHFIDALGCPGVRRMARADGPRDGGQVLVHRQRLEDVALLRHPADARSRALVRRQPVQHDAAEQDGAAVLVRGARQGVHQGGLARAIAAQQRQGLALGQRKAHVLQHHGLAIARAQALNLQQIRHGSPPLRGRDTPP
ncbi:MAG: hypothetical protein BWX79_02174 [Alphaproteobacteria bacterium ADurb.Bin100]|nr:MAG: hypothetical protein BWX79_02174 [Alphaproteobacteria bacterium ADurb.Bin100]